MIAQLAIVMSIAAVVGVLYGMRVRHIRYLQRHVEVLGGRDRWQERCTHCGRRMRDAASIRQTTRTPSDGGGWVERMDGVFHLDRPACATAADKVQEGAR